MKNRVVLFVICFCINNFSQTVVSPQFSELRGMENQDGNTHLFYRLYSFHKGGVPIGDYHENSIYHIDLKNNFDTLFLFDGGTFGDRITSIIELEFWNDNPATFIYIGESISVDPEAFVQRFDQAVPSYYNLGEAFGMETGKQNDSLVIASAPNLIKSTDGGINWTPFLTEYPSIVSITPYNDDEMFFNNGNKELLKTTDGGQTFSIVDTNHYNPQLFYDIDSDHIYSLMYNRLKVSGNKGDAFSWTERYASANLIYLSVDKLHSGSVYLADGKSINHSTDYGKNFNIYTKLYRNIVGIYKKPNSDKLYAATKYKIYEINSDTIRVIKSLPVPENILSLYPLKSGNKWVFDEDRISYNPYPTGSHRITTREVLRDTVAPNGKQYYLLKDETVFGSYFLERVDSLEGKVYRYDESLNSSGYEYVIDDLLANAGDTVLSYRMGYWEDGFTRVLDKTIFKKWGLEKSKKVFENYVLYPPVYSLTQDIGLDSIYYYFDFGEGWIILKGCIIDGIVYGDTTIVSVEDESSIVNSFKLKQNYPNPFNPTTIIRYEIHAIGSVTLKVYDILGREVATLVNEVKPAGNYEIKFNVKSLPSGVYFYQLKAGSFIQTRKMIYLK